MTAKDQARVFVSYAGPDRPWAEWASEQLELAGCTVELDAWDWRTGDNFALRMNQALETADHMLTLWSPAYFELHRFTTDEWSAAIAMRRERMIVPVRVSEVEPPPLLRPLIYADVFGVDEAAARAALLRAVLDRPPARIGHEFPGPLVGSRRPGSRPRVWKAPLRNRAFTGRGSLLAALRDSLLDTKGPARSWVQALNGLGGVGKTQLAAEYAHLFEGEYDLVWWVDSEQPGLIPDQLAELGVRAGWVDRGAEVSTACRVVADRLRADRRWLVVFDNVEEPNHITDHLPDGDGHVVITSRHHGFSHIAQTVRVDVFARDESVAFLQSLAPQLSRAAAVDLAEALGDLPLALNQAGGMISETSMPVTEYLSELGKLLDHGTSPGYPRTLAATVRLAARQLQENDQEYIWLLARLAAEPVPITWLKVVPGSDDTAADLRLRLSRAANLGLLTLSETHVQMHRLTQAILSDERRHQQEDDRRAAARVLAAAEPENDGADPKFWPAWAELVPHLLALPPATAPAEARKAIGNAIYYLTRRGDYASAIALGEDVYAGRSRTLGLEDPETVQIAVELAIALRRAKRAQEALDLNLSSLDIRRRTLGPEHPETLKVANNAAVCLRDLGRIEDAHDMSRRVYEIRLEVLGLEHAQTRSSANNLARDLHELGRYQEAHDLNEETLRIRRRTLRPDHPDTLSSAENLAANLHAMGRCQDSFGLNVQTLPARIRELGPDHPNTLKSVDALALDLDALERPRKMNRGGGYTPSSAPVSQPSVRDCKPGDSKSTVNFSTCARCGLKRRKPGKWRDGTADQSSPA